MNILCGCEDNAYSEKAIPPVKRYLAPMRGLTEAVYRNAFSRHFSGIDVAVSPFITTVNGKISNRHIKDALPQNNSNLPLIPQLLSKDPEGFIRVANKLFDLGYEEINWNLGCPYAMVANKMRGSGLLPYPDKIDHFLNTVLEKVPNRLSIKTRLGRFHVDEIQSVIPIFNQYPLISLTIHPRIGTQLYDGIPDLNQFESCLAMSRHPVIYNGDIRTPQDIQNICTQFPGISGIMIGRGVLANPFLLEWIDEPEKSTDLSRLKRFHDDLYDHYRQQLSGPAHVLGKMKEQWKYLSQVFFQDQNRLLKRIQRCTGFTQYETLVSNAFQDQIFYT